MGIFSRIGKALRRVVGLPPVPPKQPSSAEGQYPPREPPSVAPSPESWEWDGNWGDPFGSGDTAATTSNDGKDFDWYIAGYKGIHDTSRTDLEKDPQRILTDQELREADYLVIWYSGPMGYVTVTSGPWDDWDHLYDDLSYLYDEGGS